MLNRLEQIVDSFDTSYFSDLNYLENADTEQIDKIIHQLFDIVLESNSLIEYAIEMKYNNSQIQI